MTSWSPDFIPSAAQVADVTDLERRLLNGLVRNEYDSGDPLTAAIDSFLCLDEALQVSTLISCATGAVALLRWASDRCGLPFDEVLEAHIINARQSWAESLDKIEAEGWAG